MTCVIQISCLHTTFAMLIYENMDFHMCLKLLHLNVLSPEGKPILNGTIKNIIVFQNHPTSKQHKIHLNKKIHFKLYIKRLPKSCRLWNFNWMYKILNFNIPNEWSRKTFQKKNTKGTFFLVFLNDFNFKRSSNIPLVF